MENLDYLQGVFFILSFHFIYKFSFVIYIGNAYPHSPNFRAIAEEWALLQEKIHNNSSTVRIEDQDNHQTKPRINQSFRILVLVFLTSLYIT
ncbi:MAG: hypothetical protein EBU66_05000 [Bacteroidetes bacterium]|nr:hypothetical protein [Bacteroidota bacterium]